MSRAVLVLACTGCLIASPYVFGSRIIGWGGPRATIAIGLGALLGIASSLIVLLLAVVDPPDLPASDIPTVIGRCVDAAGQFFAHPVGHWPRIIAVLALLALGARLAYAVAATLLDARRTRTDLARIGIPREGFTVVESPEPMAFTVGFHRRIVVVSSGMLSELTGEERAAVLAHEHGHVRGWHTALWVVAQIVVRAFGFFPPARIATRFLVLGLETAADDAAVGEIGDPVAVARALLRLAEGSGSGHGAPTSALGGSESDVVTRVRRLTHPDAGTQGWRPLGSLVTVTTILLVTSLLLVLPATKRTVSAAAQGREVHASCHLPHAARDYGNGEIRDLL
ncbi:MAG: M56 family metallopeptidase [Actinomycetota bacterium]